ncbi:CHAP domain-containing protein [Roseivirga sp. BDSF3-8]|uniref:CHAP domain-containing protein n=1 Tax=Roseivirga sp. BDSF3-8 TaxID=3241598 RepID=UPI0035322A0B
MAAPVYEWGRYFPKPDDLLVMGPTLFNPYGHVAIVSQVMEDRIQIIQQTRGLQESHAYFLHWKLK